jgi:hypothetical protein
MGCLLRVRSQGGVFTTACRRGPEVGFRSITLLARSFCGTCPASRFLANFVLESIYLRSTSIGQFSGEPFLTTNSQFMRHHAIVNWSTSRLTVGGSTYGLLAVASGLESGRSGERRPVVSAFLAWDESLVPIPSEEGDRGVLSPRKLYVKTISRTEAACRFLYPKP